MLRLSWINCMAVSGSPRCDRFVLLENEDVILRQADMAASMRCGKDQHWAFRRLIDHRVVGCADEFEVGTNCVMIQHAKAQARPAIHPPSTSVG